MLTLSTVFTNASPMQDTINTTTGMSNVHLGGNISVNEMVIKINDTIIPIELSVKMTDM